ncbi:hypothetical protein RI129_012545 [Pyrocoelia pectoralis]|uniref:CRAL-TRIO domain-containing protein n=1 Tax=Pyrocoelia pectoralis TaxID=417401 RepID=A0AAN7UTL3_9COLE
MPIKLADVADEYKKNKDLREEDVKALREWVEKQPHLPQISDLQLILFLQSCYFSMEQAKTTIDTFFTIKTLCPEFFADRDPNSAKFQEDVKVGAYVPLPKYTPEGYRVIFCRIIDSDVNKYNFNDQVRSFDMSLMLWMMQGGSSEGLIMVIDMNGITLGHMTKLSLMGMKKFFLYLQEALPVRLKGLHFINVVSFMDKIMALMKPFMKKELIDMLYLHTNTIDPLFKHVPLENLPSDYGGKAGPLSELYELNKKTMSENAEFFKMDEKQLGNESKRIGKPKNASDIFGVEGSFKKLDLD